jgi:predicted GNAT family N-acyltransferase
MRIMIIVSAVQNTPLAICCGCASLQGQGLGLHLLTGALAVWDADFGGGGGLLLETQLESAVSMYTKAGFQVCGQQTQHPAGQFTNYIMHRPTPSAAALE